MAVSTLELVKQYAVNRKENLQEKFSEHEVRLRRILSHPEANARDQQYRINAFNDIFDKLKSLKENAWIVDRSFIYKFKYHATVKGNNGTVCAGNQYGIESPHEAIYYVGDMPDYAIERCEKLKDKLNFITIHSNQKLPVKTVQFKQIDPVLIGWVSNPEIELGYYRKTKIHSMNNTLGLVLAIWDMDKEIL